MSNENEEYNEEEIVQETNESGLKNFYNNNKKLVWILGGILLFILIISILPKNGKTTSDVTYEIKIKETEKDIVAIGASLNLEAEVKNNPKAVIEWTTSDENIATVDNGNVKGVGYGKVTITASYAQNSEDPLTDTKEITVADGDPNVELIDASFKDGDLFMPPYETYKIALVPNPSDAFITNKKFISSDENIVTIDENGNVTTVGEGEAIITLDVNDGKFKKELKVFVDRNQTKSEIVVTPTTISFDGELRKIKVGSTEKLTYTLEPDGADKSKLIWTSSDADVVTVDNNGKIKGIIEGHATITLSSVNGAKDEIDIEVEKDIIDVSDINLTVDTIYLTEGQNQTVTPVISPSDASNKALSFTPLDSNIAIVQANDTGTSATVYAMKAGATSIVIKATTGDNPAEALLNVIVNAKVTPQPTINTQPTNTTPTTVTYNVDFDSKGGNNIASIQVNSGNRIGSSWPSNPRRSNYIFDGWYDNSYRTKYSSSTIVNGDMKLYAKWKASIKLANLSPSTSSITLKPGGTSRIALNYTGTEQLEDYIYKSSDSSVVTVDNYGSIKAIKSGTAIITIAGKSSGYTYDITIKVDTIAPNFTVIKPTKTSINVGDFTSYKVKADVKGKIVSTIKNSCIVFRTSAHSSLDIGTTYAVNTEYEIIVTGKSACSNVEIEVQFIPDDNTLYSTPSSEKFNISVTNPKPKILSSYSFHTQELDKLTPNYKKYKGKNGLDYQTLVWTEFRHQVGIYVKDDGTVDRIAYASSESLSDINNLSYNDYNDCGTVSHYGWAFAKVNNGTKCRTKISDFSKSKDSQYNYAFHLVALGDYNTYAAKIYLSIRTVNSKNVMSDPVIYKIERSAGQNQDSVPVWICTDNNTCSSTKRVYGYDPY